MSMHLHHPSLSLNGRKKGKVKFRNAEEARKARELEASWQELKKKWVVEEDDRRRRRAMSAPPLAGNYSLTIPENRSTRHIPSRDTGGSATLAAPKVYTGGTITQASHQGQQGGNGCGVQHNYCQPAQGLG